MARLRFAFGRLAIVLALLLTGGISALAADDTQLDFGDAPDGPYPTTLNNDGARHVIGGPWLGDSTGQPDAEADGQPDPNATGDDLDISSVGPNDDEDGIIIPPLVRGQQVLLTVETGGRGYLDAWIDFDNDGTWKANDKVYGGLMSDGKHTLGVSVPTDAVLGQTFGRFRISEQGGLRAKGEAPDGEVEDHQAWVVTLPPDTKWAQLPDLTPHGIDICANGPRILADDFVCRTFGPITGIQLWGSWKNDQKSEINRIHLSLHSDDPVGLAGSDPSNEHSKPDRLLWEQDFGPGQFNEELYYAAPKPVEYWWDPETQELIPSGDAEVWRIDVDIDPEKAFVQMGSPHQPVIYWLMVQVETECGQFGWKTRQWLQHDRDNAVWRISSNLPSDWKELRYPEGHPLHYLLRDSIDMAFVVVGEILPQPPQACCLPDGSCVCTRPEECLQMGGIPQGPGTDCFTIDCPIVVDCNWEPGDPYKMHWAQLPDLSQAGMDVEMYWAPLADDFKCTATGPITDIHIWGSFATDYVPRAAPGSLTFQLTIYSNAAADDVTPWSRPGEPLWTRQFAPGEYTVREVASDSAEDWYDPARPWYVKADHTKAYQYNFCVGNNPFIQQEGGIYWLEVQDLPRDESRDYRFGWKTTPLDLRWNDDAAWLDIYAQQAQWQPLKYPKDHEYHGQSLDLAFVITGREEEPAEHDLGDAPDSTNSFAWRPMTAYPKGGPAGVWADFPTVYRAGSPPFGPIHLQPKALAYLGEYVTRENEADSGPDEDGVNNINPRRDRPDQDRADDGVQVPLALPHCQQTTFDYVVTVANPIYRSIMVNVWFDWNRDGDWDDVLDCPEGRSAPEWAVQNQQLHLSGPGKFTFTTPRFMCWHPPTAVRPNPIWMRITVSERQWGPVFASATGYGGSGPQNGYKYGETEDYYFVPSEPGPLELDFGDAPDSYGTTLANSGPSHVIGGPWLGGATDGPDSEADGQPDADALGDDDDGNDDEDGVFIPPLIKGQSVSITLQVSGGGGSVQGWLDWDADGTWQASEQIYNGFLPDGVHTVSVSVPNAAAAGQTFARFRISSRGGLGPAGPARDGEIEDHEVWIEQLPPNTKWTQLPDVTPYGIDIRVDRLRTIADDFECTSHSRITDVHLWGSWKNDSKGEIRRIRLSIHPDDPAGPAGPSPDNPFSQPGPNVLWAKEFGPGQFSETLYCVLPGPGEYWWDPADHELIAGGDREVWRIDIDIDPDEAFVQKGSSDEPVIYWLDVRVETEHGEFGWKTRQWPEHYMDDAVWDYGSELPRIWKELRYPHGHPYHGFDFEDLPLGTRYHVGDTFITSGVPIHVNRFQWSNGNWTSTGHARVVDQGRAGGSGKEININNANLEFDLPGPLTNLAFLFGEYGGNLNIEINGHFRNFHNFANINGLTIGGVTVSVVNGLGNDKGVLRLAGNINQFAIGGQELWIDNVTSNSIDMAFIITAEEEFPPAKPPVEHLKWSQPPIEIDPMAKTLVYCGWDEPSYGVELAPMLWFDCWDCPTQCYGDADCDGEVDSSDFQRLLRAFFTQYDVDPYYDACTDFDRDLHVDFNDFDILQDYFAKDLTTQPACPLRPGIEFWQIVADDFRCLGNMPVTSVHWWGSYKGWDGAEPPEPKPIAWRIGFWSNVPSDRLAGPEYSHPGMLLWQIEVPADRVEQTTAGIDQFPGKPSDTCYQYYVKLKPAEYFWQHAEGDIFWLSITAIYRGVAPEMFHPWGWKTRPAHWMDDAVRFRLDGEPEPGTVLDAEIFTPIEESLVCGEPQSYDVAFELDTDPDYIKWEQAFTGIRHWQHYHDEKSIATERTAAEPGIKYMQEPDLHDSGIDVDATTAYTWLWPAQTLADDYPCTLTGPLTDIRIWGSWYRDYLPSDGPEAVTFTVSIHEDIPAYKSPTGYSMPGRPLWRRQFEPGDFEVSMHADNLKEGWYVPCTSPPYYRSSADTTCWQYDFHIEASDAFIQKGSPEKRVVYWLAVQARPMFAADTSEPDVIVVPERPVRFGWKSSLEHWNDDAVWAKGKELHTDAWNELRYPSQHPYRRQSIDLAFAITTKKDNQQLEIQRLVADDWRCERRTPVTAMVWWGSYIDYRYQPCQCVQMVRPVKPDYFLLSIWTDVPATSDVPHSHPGEKIWEYKASDYDEVLVGYDKHADPVIAIYPPVPAAREPVFRYSVRLPQEKWFCQENDDTIYWFSVVAVYEATAADIRYPWGWTNHEHQFSDDAVAGYLDTDGLSPVWRWQELYDQTGDSQDMSFMLFTEPGCLPCTYSTYNDWLALGKPNCWCGIYGTPPWPYQCDGDADGGIETLFQYRIYGKDLALVVENWKRKIDDPLLDACADIDHKAQTVFKYRVYGKDLATVVTNWKKKDTELAGDCPRPE